MVEASDRRSAVHLQLMHNEHLLQLIDRALSGMHTPYESGPL